MNEHPGIPALVLIPGNAELDYAAIYSIAVAYADSGLLVSSIGREEDRIEFSFPAIVCSSFAIELFLKFFLVLEMSEDDASMSKSNKGHRIMVLWEKISRRRRALIAGMYRNSSDTPITQESDRRIELFIAALAHIGDEPFVKWRYAHEARAISYMSHAAISEVVEAFRRAATYAMKEKQQTSNDVKQETSCSEPPVSNVENGSDIGSGRVIRRSGIDLLIVRPPEPLILGRDSAFRRIPAKLHPDQTLFLDGIRHSAETLDLTYGRVREALSNLALNPPASVEMPDLLVRIFVDAWAFVYAVDRFRVMYLQMPGMKLERRDGNTLTLEEVTHEFRLLRIAADRLARGNNTLGLTQTGAFGQLDWLTGVQIQPELRAFHCTLRPGALSKHPSQCEDPMTSTLEWPTDAIQLSLGERKANLSAVRKHIEIRFRSMEKQLELIFKSAEQDQIPIFNDVFMRRAVRQQPEY